MLLFMAGCETCLVTLCHARRVGCFWTATLTCSNGYSASHAPAPRCGFGPGSHVLEKVFGLGVRKSRIQNLQAEEYCSMVQCFPFCGSVQITREGKFQFTVSPYQVDSLLNMSLTDCWNVILFLHRHARSQGVNV